MAYLGSYLTITKSFNQETLIFLLSPLYQCPLGSQFIQNMNSSFIHVYEFTY